MLSSLLGRLQPSGELGARGRFQSLPQRVQHSRQVSGPEGVAVQPQPREDLAAQHALLTRRQRLVHPLAQDEPIYAPSHTDGICLNTSAWLDGKPLMEKGQIVNEELLPLAEKLGKA